MSVYGNCVPRSGRRAASRRGGDGRRARSACSGGFPPIPRCLLAIVKRQGGVGGGRLAEPNRKMLVGYAARASCLPQRKAEKRVRVGLTDPLNFHTAEEVCASVLFGMAISPNLFMRRGNRGSGMLGISS